MENLRLIYDFADRSPRIGVVFFTLLFFVIGLAVFFYHKNIDKASAGFSKSKRNYGMFFGILFASFSALISIFIIALSTNEYTATKKIYDQKKYKIVEGKVENYHPMPEGGHDSERFTVNGILFEYSDYDLTNYGYNNAASKGGVIKERLNVRIAYYYNGSKNVILKLEVE